MHEISLIQNLLESVLHQIEADQHSPAAVKGLAVTLGALELHSPEAFRQAFATESRGTALEGTALELTIVPVKLQCSQCGFHGPLSGDKNDPHNPDLIVECPKCGVPVAVKGGRGVQKIELILDS